MIDARGALTAIEAQQTVPFDIKRVYFLNRIKADRAGHAHRDTQQLVIAVAGQFQLELSNGKQSCVHYLEDSSRGLYIPPMLFIRLSHFSDDAVVMVMASTHYDKSRSIRSWDEYVAEVT